MSKQSIIYLAGDRLVLVQGKPGAKKLAVTGYRQQALPEGTVLNGVVADPGAFTDGLKALRAAAGKAAGKAWNPWKRSMHSTGRWCIAFCWAFAAASTWRRSFARKLFSRR